jgi:hypothetical protein
MHARTRKCPALHFALPRPPLPGCSQIETVAPWDGEDGKLEVVEEFSLEDLDL